MLFKDIKVGKTYEVKSLGKIVKVKVTEKRKLETFYRVEYEYSEINFLGCTKGWQFSKTNDFPNIRTVAE